VALLQTFLDSKEVTERVLTVVRNFEKVDPAKVPPTPRPRPLLRLLAFCRDLAVTTATSHLVVVGLWCCHRLSFSLKGPALEVFLVIRRLFFWLWLWLDVALFRIGVVLCCVGRCILPHPRLLDCLPLHHEHGPWESCGGAGVALPRSRDT
jgi:hypothetical protein